MKKGPKGHPPQDQPDSFQGTRVDLGEDLLEETATLGRDTGLSTPPVPDEQAPVAIDEVEDKFQSAKILFAEGFVDESKRILRKILIADPHHVSARKKLAEIHEVELKQLFGDDRRRRPPKLGEKRDEVPGDFDVEEILRELDRDLKLGIFEGRAELDKREGAAALPPFFQDPDAVEIYADRLDRDLGELSGQDRVDLGIGFLVMGLHELAMRQFRSACLVYLRAPEENAALILAATGLTAYTLILVGRPYEATMMIQSILRDTEIGETQKLDFFYLMGRAYEMMGKPDLARLWYEQVRKTDPRYRDVGGRLREQRSAKPQG